MVLFIIGIIYLVIGIIYSIVLQTALAGIERENKVEEYIDEMFGDQNEEVRMVYGHDKTWTWNLLRMVSAIGAVILWPVYIIFTIKDYKEN